MAEHDLPAAHPDLARLGARPASRPADLVARALDPAVVLLVTLVVVGIHATWPRVLPGLGWALGGATWCVLLPLGVLWLAMRRGWVSERHVVRREERVRPQLLACVLVAIGTGLFWLTGAPREVLTVLVAVALALVVSTLITLVWKISVHVGTLAGMTAVLTILLGRWVAAVGVVLVLLLGWSRWRAGRHTLGQVAAGALLGAGLCAVVTRFLAG